MTDIEVICQAVEGYACNTVKALFGFSSLPTQTLVRYAVRNIFDRYGNLASVFVDQSGKLREDLLFDAFKAELRDRGGYEFLGIRFTDADIEEISRIYKGLQEHNNV